MTVNAGAASDTISPTTTTSNRPISLVLSAATIALIGVGVVTGLNTYLNRSPVRAAHVAGTSAWSQQLIIAGVAVVLYGLALWLHRRRPGRGSGRLLLLAPIGTSAMARLAATMREGSWRTLAVLPPLALIAYCWWRTGEQVIGGLDPNFTANAWGGPSYLGAMFCHYLDGGLIIAACAWLLNWIMIPARDIRTR
jgi:hypothetical protein